MVDTISMKEYVDLRIGAVDAKANMRHEALAEATKLKADTLEKRFENTNEWRDTVTDIISKSATKDDLKNVLGKIAEFEQFKNSRLDIPGDIKTLFSAVTDIKEWRAKQEGKASQSSVVWVYIISATSFVLTLITLLEKFTK
jgi:hypothetical protein